MNWDKTELNAEFLQAYESYSDAIFRHCFFRVYNREESVDIVQEAFIRTWEYIAKGNEVQNIRAFLYRVANNLIIDRSRKKKPVSLDELQDFGFDPGLDETDRIQHHLEGNEALRLIAAVDKKYQDVIIMRYIDDMSPREIADIIKESENAVSVRIHRGLKKVREIMGEQGKQKNE